MIKYFNKIDIIYIPISIYNIFEDKVTNINRNIEINDLINIPNNYKYIKNIKNIENNNYIYYY